MEEAAVWLPDSLHQLKDKYVSINAKRNLKKNVFLSQYFLFFFGHISLFFGPYQHIFKAIFCHY